jgi:hypothetical protein
MQWVSSDEIAISLEPIVTVDDVELPAICSNGSLDDVSRRKEEEDRSEALEMPAGDRRFAQATTS